MVVFVGLGNPGNEYSNTKHNSGYLIINELAKRWTCNFNPGKENYVFASPGGIWRSPAQSWAV